MPFCEITGHRFAARLEYRVTRDIAANCSVVHITRVGVRSVWACSSTNVWVLGSIRVNGTPAAVMELSSTVSCEATLSGEYFTGGEGIWSGFRSWDVTVAHDADGSARPEIGLELRVYLKNETQLSPGIASAVAVSLPGIPRVTELSAQGVPLGQEMTIRLSRALERFRDSVDWRCGEASGTLAENTGETSLRWVPPRGLAVHWPEAASAAVTLTVRTYDGTGQVGQRSVSVQCPIPEDMVPTLTLSVSDAMGYTQTHGGYIRSQSRVRVCTAAAGSQGSRITSVAVHCGGLTAQGEDVTFSPADSGEIPIRVTVTDSRGRQASGAAAITVLPYDRPWAQIRQIYRCDSAGTARPDGGYVKVVFDGGVTEVQAGTAAYRAELLPRGGTVWSSTPLTDFQGHVSVTGGSAVLPAAVDSSYECRIVAEDSFQAVSGPQVPVSTAFVLLDMHRDTRALGLGIRARTANALSVGLDMDMTEHRLQNLASPAAPGDAATKEYVDSCIQTLARALGVTIA